MCGIIGIVGNDPCLNGLLDGLSRLDYRGYDSAGVLVYDPSNGAQMVKSAGRLSLLRGRTHGMEGHIGIAHTRWATHGRPNETNAHPHRAGNLVLVHNGIIENFLDLKSELQGQGVALLSETDTEVFGHLIDREVTAAGDIATGLRNALAIAEGSYALSLWFDEDPECIWFARNASPLVVGLAGDHNVVASDPLALVRHTDKVVYVDDGVYGRATAKAVEFYRVSDGEALQPEVQTLTWSGVEVDKGPFKHYMIKEIYEQPDAVLATMDHLLGTVDGGPPSDLMNLTEEFAQSIEFVELLACGTSLHAAKVARYYFERLAGIPSSTDQAGEWTSLGLPIRPGTFTLSLSQSGETADTLTALRRVKGANGTLGAVVNVQGSSIARMSDYVFHTMAGPEVSVASTKAFTTQLAATYLLAARLGYLRKHLDETQYKDAIDGLRHAVVLMRGILVQEARARELALQLTHYQQALFLGRGILYPIALEGALKLKEISYLHAEGYSAAEMKHGPIALIDEHMATVMLVPRGPDYSKALGNLQEIKARDGFVLAVVTEGDDERLTYHTNGMFPVPEAPELLQPLIAVIPLQLIAYHVADYRGTDIDKPRNLAKSVTVE